ncbi:MAG: hypothetical protein QMD13_08020 [Candidatus Bathyarchaeia archaeon]|nr:hypothetical protein [Candidatus Bathyarchaeia archaeon]
MSVQQKLKALYREIDQCNRCPLGSLEINKPPRPIIKLGVRKILIISQNPSSRRTGEAHVWGGLDILFRFDKELKPMLEEVYITNVIKCCGRPSFKKATTCAVWLGGEMGIIKPQRNIFLGRFAERIWLKEEFAEPFHLLHPNFIVRFRRGEIGSYIKSLKEILE